jgi:hypothetical protein
MQLIELNENPNAKLSAKSNLYHTQIEYILRDLSGRDIPHYVAQAINDAVQEINLTTKIDYALHKLLKQKQRDIIKLLEKELKIVPINYYRNLWMVIGMTVFGVPTGVAFGTAIGSMAFMGLWLPIGMAIGMAVGSVLDRKAQEDGRQLSVEVKL